MKLEMTISVNGYKFKIDKRYLKDEDLKALVAMERLEEFVHRKFASRYRDSLTKEGKVKTTVTPAQPGEVWKLEEGDRFVYRQTNPADYAYAESHFIDET